MSYWSTSRKTAGFLGMLAELQRDLSEEVSQDNGVEEGVWVSEEQEQGGQNRVEEMANQAWEGVGL